MHVGEEGLTRRFDAARLDFLRGAPITFQGFVCYLKIGRASNVTGSSRGDFAADKRLLILSGFGIGIGAVCALVAVVLLSLIAFFTNLFYFHEWSLTPRIPA